VVIPTATPQEKHIPQRTCLGCRTTKPKRSLTRIVRTAEGRVIIDTTGKARGRGAYFCPAVDCARQALRANVLSRALRVTIDDGALAELRAAVEQITETACTSANAPQASLPPQAHRSGRILPREEGQQ
jgi:predicted RNA-binding protein YlxR (DUF448 family)